MKYESLHDYLDEVFYGKNPSPSQIKAAKQAYWKLWFKYYRREVRKQYKEFTLRLHPLELKAIKAKKEEQSISAFLYAAVKKAIASPKTTTLDPSLIGTLEQQLMEIIHLLEELLENESNSITEAILERMEALAEDIHILKAKMSL